MILFKIVCFFVKFNFILSITCPVEKKEANCTGKGLTKVPQDLPKDLESLDLSSNHLRKLSNYSFNRYAYLRTLTIQKNNLVLLEEYAFFGLTKLQKLDLSSNHLNLTHAYPKHVFQPLNFSLITLNLRENIINVPILTAYPFFGHLYNLEHLYIDLARKPDFKTCGFNRLPNLKVVKFDKCYLDSMLNTTFMHMSTYVKELHFQGCTIHGPTEANFLSNFGTLKELTLHKVCTSLDAAMMILYPFVNKHMDKIDFTYVNPGICHGPVTMAKAVIVSRKTVFYLQQICVKDLLLVENGIVDFEPNSLLRYEHPECFEKIVFSRNRFSIIDGFKGNELITFSVRLKNLREFEFSFNPISYAHSIQTPDSRHISVGTDTGPELELIGSLDSDVTFNEESRTKGKVINEKTVGNFKQQTNDGSVTIHFFLPPKIQTLRLSNWMQSEGINNTQHIIIQHSENLREVDISYFQMKSFPKLNFTSENNINFIDVSGIDALILSDNINLPLFKNSKIINMRHCRLGRALHNKGKQIFSLVPSVEKIDLSSNNLWFLPVNALLTNLRLNHLIMNYNIFSEIPLAVMSLPNLQKLEMKYNMLLTINATVRNWLDKQQNILNKTFSLYLSGNVFKCSCENREFIRWIFSTKTVFDRPNKKNYKCRLDNGTVTNTRVVYDNFQQIFSGCDSGIWLRIGIVLLSTFVVLAIPTGIIINFRWRITYWIFRKFRTVVEEKVKTIFVYDVYVSYGSDSLYWIKNTLVSRLENSWKMKVCVEDRDILGGEVLLDSISKSIQESRNVIFVISKEFQERDLGTFEIHMAKFERFTRSLRQIVVITRNVTIEQVPPELGKIWNDVTLVEWSDTDTENSWDKLRVALLAKNYLY